MFTRPKTHQNPRVWKNEFTTAEVFIAAQPARVRSDVAEIVLEGSANCEKLKSCYAPGVFDGLGTPLA